MNIYRKNIGFIPSIVLSISISMFFFGGCSAPHETIGDSRKIEFHPQEVFESTEGLASYYGKKFHGRLTANGEKFNRYLYSAAHKTYPFGTILRVTRISTGRVVLVRVNDRGPYKKDRILDLSYAAAKELAMLKSGLAQVKIEVLSWGEDNSSIAKNEP